MSGQDDLPPQIYFMRGAVIDLALRMKSEGQALEVSVGLSEVVVDNFPYPTNDDISTVVTLAGQDVSLVEAGVVVGFDEPASAFVFTFN